jgi:hypothetical protein
MISGAYRVLHLHAEGGGVKHHDGIPAVQNLTKLVALFIILKLLDFLFIILLPQGKKVGGAARCECVSDVHTSKASERLKVALLHLWRINVKTTGGFINIPVEDFHVV